MKNFISLTGYLLYRENKSTRYVVAGLVLALTGCLAFLVYFTGGTRFSYLQFLYVPVIIAGFWFGALWGIVFGILVGLVVGPWMPESVSEQMMQNHEIWIVRMVFFAMMGALAGFGARITKEYFKVLEERFFKDGVTELLNYSGLHHRYNKAAALKSLSGLIVIKLKQLSEVETVFGPETVNKVAVIFAQRLMQLMNQKHTLGRLSSDCFLVCVEKEDDALKLAQALVEQLDNTYEFNQIPFLIESHYGVVTIQNEQAYFNTLVKNALVAVEYGIQNNRVLREYDKKPNKNLERNLVILHELNKAIKNNDITLHYQPLVSLKDGSVWGVEALARWGHECFGSVSPSEFMSVAEKTLLINPLTRGLIRQSLYALSQWREKGLNIVLSLNFSMLNLEDETVIEELLHYLAAYRIPPEMVEIEVTETVISNNPFHAAVALQTLREKNIKVAIDDFGTGHSSLKYLFDLPVDMIKIDQSFVAAMMDNPAAEAIIRSTTTMGHTLNLKVLAEGVESASQFDHLKTVGCDYAQGFFISRPLPFDLMTKWLEEKKQAQLEPVDPV